MVAFAAHTPGRDTTMHLCSYQLRFQTPAFLDNAQQQGQWRTLPFKALLRQWWQRLGRNVVEIVARKVRLSKAAA
jgi:CRISPR-associated protein Cmr1